MTASITPTTGAAHARILSVAGYRPERIVTNEEICERIDSSDEWIRERSGIIERRYAATDESVVDLAVAAAQRALDAAGVTADQIDIGRARGRCARGRSRWRAPPASPARG